MLATAKSPKLSFPLQFDALLTGAGIELFDWKIPAASKGILADTDGFVAVNDLSHSRDNTANYFLHRNFASLQILESELPQTSESAARFEITLLHKGFIKSGELREFVGLAYDFRVCLGGVVNQFVVPFTDVNQRLQYCNFEEYFFSYLPNSA